MKRKALILLLAAATLLSGCLAPPAPTTVPPAPTAADRPAASSSPLPAPRHTPPPTVTPPAPPQATPPTPTGPTPTLDPNWDWPVSAPDRQGMDPALLAELPQAAVREFPALHSLLVIRNGAIVSENYFLGHTASTRHTVYSITKSVDSALIGIAMQQGYIQSVDQPVLDFFPGRGFDNMDDRKASITLRHVLTMTSGLGWIDGDPYWAQISSSPDWLAYMLGLPMATDPGKQFNYCSGCSHILSWIIYATTGSTPQEYADRYLFGPLGIRGEVWEADAQGVSIGGWGLHLTSRDLARLGQLYLDRGRWQGQQVVPADWVAESTKPLVPASNNLDYGYQWWFNQSLNGFAALGADGQMIFVHPQTNLVVVMTSGSSDHTAEFELIRQYILAAVEK